MPKPVNASKSALRELVRSVRSIAIARATVNAVIFFLVSVLVMQLFTLKWYWGALVALPFMIWTFWKNLRRANLYLVENTVGELKHMLTTTSDTLHRDNEVIRALRKEMLVKLKDVKNSYFIKFGKLGIKVVAIMIISVTVVSLAAFNVRLLDFEKTAQDAASGRLFQTYDVDTSQLGFELNESEDIYGEKSVAKLGLEELQLQINPVSSDIDISQVDEAGRREFAVERSAQEIIASNDASYSEDIPKEYRKIVKFYFNEISKGE